MSSGGLTEQGLSDLHRVLAAHVDGGAMPGLVALVARQDHVWVDVIGTKDFGDPEPLRRDDIFRIASLSKPIGTAATMVLIERGVLQRTDPVDRWLPELADRRVLRHIGAELDDTVPARRPITVEDLLNSQMGFGNIMVPPDTYPIQRAERELQLLTLEPPWPPTTDTGDDWMRKFGTLPLMSQPGEEWHYNTSHSVLSVLLERVSGQPLEVLLRDTVLDPLGMGDTAFSVAPADAPRLTTAYAPDPESGVLGLLDSAAESYWGHPPRFPSTAGWLVSTLDDYWSFVRMIIGGGAADGTRVLSQESVRLMTTDHLTEAQRAASTIFLGDDGGWGFGLRVPAAGRTSEQGPRLLGWDGGIGTTWRTDIDAGLTMVLFTQRAMTSPEPPAVFTEFWDAAAQTLDG
jgi:CubicO group peptidase (beta-lactamase class C family)